MLVCDGDQHVHPVRGFNPEAHRYDCTRDGCRPDHQPDAFLDHAVPPAGLVLQRHGQPDFPHVQATDDA
ncbi:hypothetical protein D3C84_1266160 [compost metagenome]